MYLYIDSTEKLVIGLLNSDYEWVDYFEKDIRSASSQIQGIIHDNLLQKNNKSLEDITKVFQTSGPGSYTGMRVSEGLCQVLDWHDFPVYSFYHFEVPQLMGVEEGEWKANAYKGDVFTYKWKGEEENYHLERLESIKISEDESFYTHFHKDPFEFVEDKNLTSVMIKENPSKFFKLIESKGIRREPYYYRPLEVEFTKPKK